MWVFAGGMFRSGSTLQYQLVSELIERAKLGRRVEWTMPDDFGALADEMGPESDERRPMLVFKTHVCKQPMRERLRDGRAVAVRVHRDLRDVVVSGAQKEGVEPTPEYCRKTVIGNIACANGWPGVVSVRSWSYERLTTRTADVILEMAAHIGVDCSEAVAHELAAEYAPDRQRARIADAIESGRMVAAVPGDTRLHAESDLLHPNHLRDGETGKWRSVLGSESIKIIEELAGEWLVAHGYELSTGSRRGTA